MYDIIIIGAGCAGMTAAVYASRAGKKVLLLEAESFGGQIASSPRVENFPSIRQISGAEFASNLYEQAEALGVQPELEKVTGIRTQGSQKIVVTEDGEYECGAVIIATGVHPRVLGIEGEEDFIGNGISFCAVCDGAFFKDSDVAVVGGGNTALQDTLYLSQICRSVLLIHRRDEFRGEAEMVAAVRKKENVKLVLSSVVDGIAGKDCVEGISVKDLGNDEKTEFSVSAIFIAIGQKPDNEAFREIVQLDENGFIVAGEDCKTSTSGIFVAGDCRTKEVRQLTTAASDGAVAALAACGYLM